MGKLLVVLALAAICAAEPEAEAKAAADPYLLYGGYGLGYRGYGGYYGHGLGHYGYGLGYYGKRSAEAEPEAKAAADPYLVRWIRPLRIRSRPLRIRSRPLRIRSRLLRQRPGTRIRLRQEVC